MLSAIMPSWKLERATNLAFALIISLVFVGCGIKPPATPTVENDGPLHTYIRDYYDVMSKRDWKAYKKYFTDDAVLTTIGQPEGSSRLKIYTNSITDFIKSTPEGPDSQPIFEEQPMKIEVVRSGDLASVWVHYQAKFGTKSDLMEWTGYDLFSLIKFKGKWYISSLTYYADE